MNKKIKCWEHFKCNQKDCPVYQSKELNCWLISGTCCHDDVQGNFVQKMEMCIDCKPFQENIDTESLKETFQLCRQLHENSIRTIEDKDRVLGVINTEMASGLSEVLDALKKISSGDPLVRISETSELDIIAKLKQMINQTAENLSEIVDLAHEFAIGLAEHFDVLNRVSAGDLSARVGGGSEVELLEALKHITNNMIESVAKEISERKQAEAFIKQSEEKYRTLVENIQDGLFIIQAGKMQFANEAFAGMIGYTVDEIIGIDFKNLVAPEDLEMVLDRYRRRLAGEGVEKEYELSMLHKDGISRVIVNMTVGLFRYQDELASMGTVKDVTEHKRAEEEKSRLMERLQRSQKMEAIGTLAGGVAHDLNNILSGIVSYPELLLMDLPEDSRLRKPILTIKQSGERAAAIVQDLLTLARRGVVTNEVLNLNDIISGYLKSPECDKLKFDCPGIRIETRLEKNLLNILGSSIHLNKTIMNLIINASEAMLDRKEIIIGTENLYIDRPIRGYDDVKEGDYVILTVTDTGVGILKEDMERIFEPFYTKKVMGRSGTGLGMAVVWGIVKDHEGYIELESAENKGTTFRLYFPVTREVLEKHKTIVPFENYRGNGESIMVVDDVAEQRQIATEMLTKLGYTVSSASSGEEAVDFLKKKSVDLVVLDMIMEPGMDGLDTYRKIIELYPGQRAIIASGFSETDRVKETQKLGAGEYVKKPYLFENIGMAVKNELKK